MDLSTGCQRDSEVWEEQRESQELWLEGCESAARGTQGWHQTRSPGATRQCRGRRLSFPLQCRCKAWAPSVMDFSCIQFITVSEPGMLLFPSLCVSRVLWSDLTCIGSTLRDFCCSLVNICGPGFQNNELDKVSSTLYAMSVTFHCLFLNSLRLHLGFLTALYWWHLPV